MRYLTLILTCHSLGLPKRVERFMFYEILDVPQFRRHLIDLLPTITTMNQVISDLDAINKAKGAGNTDLLPISGTNIAFSQIGLRKVRLKYDFGNIYGLNSACKDRN
jgi:hypothetical protein